MSTNEITARLFLHAVLPGLGELVARDTEARQAIEGVDTTMQFCILGGPSVVLTVNDGQITSAPGRKLNAGMVFSHVSPGHLVKVFKEEKGMPVLWKGFWHLKAVKGFMALSKRLSTLMNIDPDEATDEEKAVLVPLLLDIALRGISVLGAYDHHLQRTVAGMADATAEFQIPGLPSRWISRRNGEFIVEKDPVRDPDAVMEFADLDTAFDLLTGRLDAMAALGLGDVRIRGLVFYVDGLSAIMGRLDRYLK